MERKYWRIAEVAEALALSKSKVALMIRSGDLKGTYIGRSVRVAASDLDDFIQQRCDDGGRLDHE